MSVRIGNNVVVDLAKYRANVSHKQQRQEQVKPTVPDDLLDKIAYHLLMAGRAIAEHTKKQ